MGNRFGRVKKVSMMIDRKSRSNNNYQEQQHGEQDGPKKIAYIEFETHEMAEKAKNSTSPIMNNRFIKVWDDLTS